MNLTLLKALAVLVPVSAACIVSAAAFAKEKKMSSAIQLLGAGCLMLVVFAHVCEALRLFQWMRWGDPHSTGHYLDLVSAILGLTLLPFGYGLRVLIARRKGI
jgi:predicted Na+-dependent transporter